MAQASPKTKVRRAYKSHNAALVPPQCKPGTESLELWWRLPGWVWVIVLPPPTLTEDMSSKSQGKRWTGNLAD